MADAALYFEDVAEGDEAPELTHVLTRTDLVAYAGASGDFNPMHHDEVKAKAAGQPSVFGHGMFSMGLLGTAITDWVGIGNVKRFTVRFARQTWPDEELRRRSWSPASAPRATPTCSTSTCGCAMRTARRRWSARPRPRCPAAPDRPRPGPPRRPVVARRRGHPPGAGRCVTGRETAGYSGSGWGPVAARRPIGSTATGGVSTREGCGATASTWTPEPRRVTGRRSTLRLAVGAATLLLAASTLAACANVTVLTVSHAGDTDGVTATTIRVGALGSFSGFAASDFAPVTTGAAVYFDQLNASGGVYGRKIIYSPIVDDGTSPVGRHRRGPAAGPVQGVRRGRRGDAVLHRLVDPAVAGRPTFGIQENTNAQWSGPTMFGAGGSYSAPTLPMPQVAYVAQQTHARAAAVLAYNVAQSSGGCVSRGQGAWRIPRPHAGGRLLHPLRGGHPRRRRDPDAAGRGRLRGHLHGRHREHQALPDPPAARHGVGHPVLARRLRQPDPPQQHGRPRRRLLPPPADAVRGDRARPGRLPGHRRLQRRAAPVRTGHRAVGHRPWPAG